MSMKWAYHLSGTDRDSKGNWQPRLVWADGMVSLSAGRIPGAVPLEDARQELGTWNWREGRSSEDTWQIVSMAKQHNPTLTVDYGWETA